ncbi:MAG TPA: hypothetical protein VK988_03045 [Acidimicrobiales bacterium]|nr:hypothetical protein [Acidimicrobiales bacterium]
MDTPFSDFGDPQEWWDRHLGRSHPAFLQDDDDYDGPLEGEEGLDYDDGCYFVPSFRPACTTKPRAYFRPRWGR